MTKKVVMAITSKDQKSTSPFVVLMSRILGFCLKILAIFMVLLTIASLVDVGYVFYEEFITAKPEGILNYADILSVLGSVMIVLICTEIFKNIVFYFKDDRSHIKLVLATALIAVSRKVIILDYSATDPASIYATAAVIIATAISYWLVAYQSEA